MQLLAMIASFVFGRMNFAPRGGGIRETARELFEDAILKSRKPVILVLVGLSAVIFFCGGLFITILESTGQYDRVGYVTLTSTLGAGIILFCLASLGFAYVFAYAWPGAHRESHAHTQTHQKEHHAGTLEQALTLLVMDFVKEREIRREKEYAHPNPSATGKSRPSEPASAPIH